VQSLMHTYLNRPEAELFFKQVRAIIRKLVDWHEWNGVVILEEDTEPEIPGRSSLISRISLTLNS